MQPKIAYLVDESHGWDEGPHWQFYPENDVPRWKLENDSNDRVKRIVYWEIEDDQ